MTDKYSKDDAIESLRGIYTQAYVSNPAVALGAILEINRLAGFGDPEQAPDQSIMRDHGELKDAIRAIHDVTGPFAPAPDSEPTRPSEPDMMSESGDEPVILELRAHVREVEGNLSIVVAEVKLLADRIFTIFQRLDALEQRAECCDDRAVLHDNLAATVREISTHIRELSKENLNLSIRIRELEQQLRELRRTTPVDYRESASGPVVSGATRGFTGEPPADQEQPLPPPPPPPKKSKGFTE